MSEGTRVGYITDLVVQERGPKLRFKVGGTDAKAWATVRDGADGPEYPNPCIPAIKMAFAQETPIALDGWEKVEDDFYSEKAGRTIKGKPMFFAQRVVEASQSIFGETFQKALGIDAMGNKVQGGGVQSQGEGAAGSTPPTPPGWAETPPDAVGDPTVGSAFSGEGFAGQPYSEQPGISERARIAALEKSLEPRPTQAAPGFYGAQLVSVQWLNSSYESPYLAARKLAVACVFKAYDFGGDSMLDEWTQPDENVNTDKPRILARMVRLVTEALVRGDL